MSELRWALLILGAVFILALVFWERRRPRQASGLLERASLRESAVESPPRQVREPPLTLPEIRAREPMVARELPVVAAREEAAAPTPEAEAPPVAAEPGAPWDTEETMEPHSADDAEPSAQPEDSEAWNSDAPEEAFQEPDEAERECAGAAAGSEALPGLPPAAPMVVDWPAEHERRAVLSAASLTRPGTFDMETMDSQHYGGLSLFAVLPGPKPPGQAFDELVFAARNLNERLHGVLQDEQGTPLTPARIAQLRAQLRAGAGS